MDEQELLRALAAMQSASMDTSAAVRAVEKAVLALVVLHPHRSQLVDLTEFLLKSDAILGLKGGDQQAFFLSCYRRHGERLLLEMREIRASA